MSPRVRAICATSTRKIHANNPTRDWNRMRVFPLDHGELTVCFLSILFLNTVAFPLLSSKFKVSHL